MPAARDGTRDFATVPYVGSLAGRAWGEELWACRKPSRSTDLSHVQCVICKAQKHTISRGTCFFIAQDKRRCHKPLNINVMNLN